MCSGQACLKYACEADWAVLYLHAASQRVFAAWAVSGEDKPRVWPEDIGDWPVEALAALNGELGE